MRGRERPAVCPNAPAAKNTNASIAISLLISSTIVARSVQKTLDIDFVLPCAPLCPLWLTILAARDHIRFPPEISTPVPSHPPAAPTRSSAPPSGSPASGSRQYAAASTPLHSRRL